MDAYTRNFVQNFEDLERDVKEENHKRNIQNAYDYTDILMECTDLSRGLYECPEKPTHDLYDLIEDIRYIHNYNSCHNDDDDDDDDDDDYYHFHYDEDKYNYFLHETITDERIYEVTMTFINAVMLMNDDKRCLNRFNNAMNPLRERLDAHLKYMPGGPGYLEAGKRFNQMKTN